MIEDFKIEFNNNTLNEQYQKMSQLRKELAEEAKFKIEPIKERLAELYNKFTDKFQILFDENSKTIVRKEYSNRGEHLPRGFYCHCPIIDIIVGNIHRGQIYKRITKRSKPTYEYGFNNSGQLLFARYLYLEEFGDKYYEFIIREDNKETGVLFVLKPDGSTHIEIINETTFDEQNRIVAFSYCYFEYGKITEVDYKEYFYDNFGLKNANWYSLVVSVYSGDKYYFTHDENGYLKEYFCEPDMEPDAGYKISLKRKV